MDQPMKHAILGGAHGQVYKFVPRNNSAKTNNSEHAKPKIASENRKRKTSLVNTPSSKKRKTVTFAVKKGKGKTAKKGKAASPASQPRYRLVGFHGFRKRPKIRRKKGKKSSPKKRRRSVKKRKPQRKKKGTKRTKKRKSGRKSTKKGTSGKRKKRAGGKRKKKSIFD